MYVWTQHGLRSICLCVTEREGLIGSKRCKGETFNVKMRRAKILWFIYEIAGGQIKLWWATTVVEINRKHCFSCLYYEKSLSPMKCLIISRPPEEALGWVYLTNQTFSPCFETY